MISKSLHVEVRFEPAARTAFVQRSRDGKGFRIVLPALPPGDKTAAALVPGWVVHEAAHARFTDFTVGQGVTPREEALHQILEDLRVERLVCGVFEGARQMLGATWSTVYNQGKVARPAEQPRAARLRRCAALGACVLPRAGVAIGTGHRGPAARAGPCGHAPGRRAHGAVRAAAADRTVAEHDGGNLRARGHAAADNRSARAARAAAASRAATESRSPMHRPHKSQAEQRNRSSTRATRPYRATRTATTAQDAADASDEPPTPAESRDDAGDADNGDPADPAGEGDSATRAGGPSPGEPEAADAADATGADVGDAAQPRQEPCPPTDASAADGDEVPGDQAQPEQGSEGDDTGAAADDTVEAGDEAGDVEHGNTPPYDEKAMAQADACAQQLGDLLGQAVPDMLQDVLLAYAVEQAEDRKQGKRARVLVAGASVEPRTAVHDSRTDGAELQRRARAATTALAAQIRHLLRSLTQSKDTLGRTGRPVPTELWRLRTGNANVFEIEEEGVDPDTAVMLLLDVSGSVRGAQLALIQMTAMAVTDALEGAHGVKTAVYAFPGANGDGRRVDQIKALDERAQSANGAIASLRADGGTPLAEALYAVGPELAASTHAGKVLFVVTDGKPDDEQAAREALLAAKAQGIDVIGIGVRADVVPLFERGLRIEDIGELPRTLFAVLSERLEEQIRLAA
jgi:uncharacterized protein YegL